MVSISGYYFKATDLLKDLQDTIMGCKEEGWGDPQVQTGASTSHRYDS